MKESFSLQVLLFGSVAVASTLALRTSMGKRDHVLRCSEEDLSKDLTGKIYIVTGANSGVGLETTRQLISQKAHVIMACRRPGAADEEAKSFTEANLPGTHESMKCDLADLESVRSFCTEFLKTHDRLDGLVCNAGMVNWGEKKTTKDGFETTIGISYFGHFLMTELLLDILKKSAPSRTCIVSSVVHAGSPKSRPDIDLTDLNWETRKFDHQPAYNEAKVATTLYALELGDRLKGTGVSTASIHPGWARSNLAAGAGWFISTLLTVFKPFYYHMTDSSEESAQTTLHVMLNDEAPKHNGAYFSQHSYLYSDEECKKGGWPMVSPNPNARDLDKARELVKVTRDLVGLK